MEETEVEVEDILERRLRISLIVTSWVIHTRQKFKQIKTNGSEI